MKEIITRWSLESPSFFQNVQRVGAFLMGLSVILIGLEGQYPTVGLPDSIAKIGGYMAVAGSVMMAIAKLTVKDYEELDKKLHD